MLDTRFTHYQDVVIGTVLTTLHGRSVLLIFYPNFNISLQDTNVSTALKVQVQIQGAEQISSAKFTTLHHQLVYRLHNYALDLPSPEHHSDALMVLAESDQIPTIIQIPRQIFRHKLIKLMPLEWISNYEKFHTNTSPIQTTERFNPEEYLVYPAKLNGHFLWDSPGSGNCDPDCPCWDDWEEDDVELQRRRKPKKKKPKTSCSHNQPKSPYNPPPPSASLPIYQNELRWIAKNCKTEVLPHNQNSKPPIQPMACMMFSSTSQDYSFNFPALETQTDPQRKVITKPFIPSAITLTGHLEDPKPFEVVLNWQTQNARAQNETLVDIHKKQPPLYTPLPPQPTPTQAKDKSPMQKYSAQIIPDPSDTNQTSDLNLAVSEDPSESETESSLESSISSSDSEKSYADITKILMAQPEETEPVQSSRTDPFFEKPSDIEEDPPEASSAPNRPDHKPSNGPWFTFDDIPAAKWRDRLSKMAAWIDLQMLRANATTASILREFATRFTGSLRDWFDTLGEYRQLQFVQLPNVSYALSVIHEQFIRESAAVFEAARRDYLNMKCCSLNSKDLDFHYKRMSILFYKLNGFNDPTLKHVFLASLPEELQPDIQRQLTSLNLTIDNISLEKIFQNAKGFKKSTIATNNIEFLGMTIKYGHYQPGKHIAQELIHFPYQNLSKRQIQQFLGIINYIRDFIPHVDHHTCQLSALLKKNPPSWNNNHTLAVTMLKQIAQNSPPLKLITDGRRILQTDASDESWGTMLLEETDGKEHFIAYASGHFSDTQIHYHSVFKEILTVKHGIQKLKYHLIGYHFLVRMDNLAFPNIMNFKGKNVPEKMLLRLKDWFSKYDFSMKHIKGDHNLIPDMLSRLAKPDKSFFFISL
ncbi:hypothetical protein KPL71_001094 [Citrus sinensis]|uniref:Uncharacterized protein n=1 Tax=Citrus sinensis TaxID=2711 RepID=A0ACB8NVP7_CITSI|nr:hypothetical protein KPL71_001094 [Citrus sinensis]